MVSYDWSEAALAGAVLALALVLVLELRSTQRLRRLVGQELARIFEQLDLVRFESQQLLEQRGHQIPRPQPAAPMPAVSVPTAPPVERATADYGIAARLAAAGADAAEIAARAGLAGGEARVLAALQSARSRRVPQE
ncbi:MAG: hypothetical protein IT480_17870 [Gammaproteobacteria bacterium]|nr:hypothetical protein [Gammaproteobacteria bacterium]